MFVVAPRDEATGEAVLSVEEAKKMLRKRELTYQLRPNASNAIDLACTYFTVGRGAEALELADMVVERLGEVDRIPPNVKSTIYFNRGMFLRGFGRFREAQADIRHAWALDQASAYVAMARAEEHLRDGEWSQGWKLHNRIRGTCDGGALACGLPVSCKFWDGAEVPSHLLVINEGGAGDRINYSRYLPLLSERGINWSFFCFDELKPFYDRLPWIGADRTIGETQKLEFSPPPSHWTTTFSLAGPLGIDPKAIPDFETPFTAPEHPFTFNNLNGLPLIGLCWSANELFQGGLKVRSLTEGQAMRLVCMTADKVNWVNLQHGHRMPYPVLNTPFESWEDTSVVLDRLDGLATVDCGTLWLSLAMKKQTAVLLSASEDWKFRWNWSDQATLYKNGESNTLFDAEKAIDKLIHDIRQGVWPWR